MNQQCKQYEEIQKLAEENKDKIYIPASGGFIIYLESNHPLIDVYV